MNTFTKKDARKALEDEQLKNSANFVGKKADKYQEEERKIEKSREIVIYTAQEMGEETRELIGIKARELFGLGFYFDFRTDSSLIAGAALAFNGQYKDYSLRQKFEEQKEEIHKIYLWKIQKLGM